jgi:hypothetical protein
MTVRSEKLIEWSREATSLADAYDPLSRQLEAISLVISLRVQWLNPGTRHVNEEGKIVARISYMTKQLSPKLASDLDALVIQSRKSAKSFTPLIDVADFLKDNIFGFKQGIRRRIQSISKETPGKNGSFQEKRFYIEKLTAKWNEVLTLPEELLIKTSKGLVINLQDKPGEEDLQDILKFLDTHDFENLNQ